LVPEEPIPHLLRYWDGWKRGLPATDRAERRRFLAAHWSSPFEPHAQVVRLLEDDVTEEDALAVAESTSELVLLLWAAASGTRQVFRAPVKLHGMRSEDLASWFSRSQA